MLKYENPDKEKETRALNIIFGGILVFAIGFWFGGSSRNNYNPRKAINGIDTLYYKDSVYFIRVVIDSADEAEIEYEGDNEYQ